MSSRPVRRPTELAAIRAASRSPRPLPPVPALMAALLITRERHDRKGFSLAAHRIVRATNPDWGDS